MEIEAGAKRRLADEYDGAQERARWLPRSDGPAVRDHIPGENKIATAAAALKGKQIHDARKVRNVKKRDLFNRLAADMRRMAFDVQNHDCVEARRA